MAPPIQGSKWGGMIDCRVFHRVAGKWAYSVGGLTCVDRRESDCMGQAARVSTSRSERDLVLPHGEVRPAHIRPGLEGSACTRTYGCSGGGRHRGWNPCYAPTRGPSLSVGVLGFILIYGRNAFNKYNRTYMIWDAQHNCPSGT